MIDMSQKTYRAKGELLIARIATNEAEVQRERRAAKRDGRIFKSAHRTVRIDTVEVPVTAYTIRCKPVGVEIVQNGARFHLKRTGDLYWEWDGTPPRGVSLEARARYWFVRWARERHTTVTIEMALAKGST